ncbi:MAG TPA: TetR/AcrR family transcriptional regulator [Solirubrobacteraceae bacterium]|nr:TetR/AcrR family transcriptional regulator [Solirubrobacteraceae bacterium]
MADGTLDASERDRARARARARASGSGGDSPERDAARTRSRARERGRRTQAQRREASRAALLDAAVDCLVEDGYAGLTTRRVAERAGVSQGTQMHYFPTKTAFLAEAIRHVSRRLTDEALARTVLPSRDERARTEAMLDELWRAHNEPVFLATLELWIAARTDEELRHEMRTLERDLSRLRLESAAEIFPDRASDADFRVRLEMALTSIRGLAMTRAVVGARAMQSRWCAMREHLVALLES